MRRRSAIWSRAIQLVLVSGAIIGAGGSPAQESSTEPSPLVDAARHATWEVVAALLDQGADVNERAGDGSMALMWASYWDELAVAERLLSAGADVNAANDLGATALWAAAVSGSAPMTRLLLEAGADPNAKLLLGESVLMMASRSGNPEVVEMLLSGGADPNPPAGRGQTALMWAVSQKHSQVAKLLIDHGADVHARSDVWSQVMAVPPHADPANQANVPHGGYTPLLFAARVGHLESARVLVAAGADVNAVDAWGISAVTLAAHSGFGDLVAFLLDAGADPSPAEAGFSALHVAIMRRDLAVVRDLLDHGADPNVPLQTWTPTRRASNDWNFHQALVGATPYWLAARFTQPEAMRLLVQHGADPLAVHRPSYIGNTGSFGSDRLTDVVTPVMAALGMSPGGAWVSPDPGDAERLILEAVQIAVELGADIHAVNEAGQSAIDQAAARRYASVVDFLVSKGAVAPAPAPSGRGGGGRGGAAQN